MLKLSPKKQLAISYVTFAFSATPVLAQEIVEVNRKFVWTAVPGTVYAPVLKNTQANLHHINTNNVVRRRNIIVFEVVTPDATYLRIEGNCQTEKVHELYWGSFEFRK